MSVSHQLRFLSKNLEWHPKHWTATEQVGEKQSNGPLKLLQKEMTKEQLGSSISKLRLMQVNYWLKSHQGGEMEDENTAKETISALKTRISTLYADVVEQQCDELVAQLKQQVMATNNQLSGVLLELDSSLTKLVLKRAEFAQYLLDEITRCIPIRDQRFCGRIVMDGSQAEGLASGIYSDYDTDYILDLIDLDSGGFSVRPIKDDPNNKMNIFVDDPKTAKLWKDLMVDGRLDDNKVRDRFYNVVFQVVANVKLPSGVVHAGCLTPYYSGPRKTHPGVKLQFLVDGILLSFDVVPSIMVNSAIRELWTEDMKQQYKTLIGLSGKEAGPVQFGKLSEKVMLKASGTGWQYATARIQSYILGLFGQGSLVKTTLKHCKEIKNKYLAIRPPNLDSGLRYLVDQLKEVLGFVNDDVLLELIDDLYDAGNVELLMLVGKAMAENGKKNAAMLKLQQSFQVLDVGISVDPAVLRFCHEADSRIVHIPTVAFTILVFNDIVKAGTKMDNGKPGSLPTRMPFVREIVSQYREKVDKNDEIALFKTKDGWSFTSVDPPQRINYEKKAMAVIHKNLVDRVAAIIKGTI